MIICVVLLCQVIIGFVYICTLNVICRKKYFIGIKDEILRLNIDINEDIADLRRKLMENSELSCSVADLKKAIEHIKKDIK